MKPTIGRLVHYVNNGIIRPALIMEVLDDNKVSLNIFLPGTEIYMQNVDYSQEYADDKWSWPPRAS